MAREDSRIQTAGMQFTRTEMLKLSVLGGRLVLSGRLTSEGLGLAGQRVELQQGPAGSRRFKRIRRTGTRGDGGFSFSGIRPRKNTYYRAVFEGDGSDYAESVSLARFVRLRR